MLLASQFDLGSERVDELTETVRAVTQADIWDRSQLASRCFSELPFETLSKGANDKPIITRGVIDLLFEEADGWVIVDYKTDEITESDIESAINYYRPQLEQYARHWLDSTGFKTSELGLYLTRIQRYVSWQP